MSGLHGAVRKEYRMFGKDYSRHSYIWRDYADFPAKVGDSHTYIVTMELVPFPAPSTAPSRWNRRSSS